MNVKRCKISKLILNSRTSETDLQQSKYEKDGKNVRSTVEKLEKLQGRRDPGSRIFPYIRDSTSWVAREPRKRTSIGRLIWNASTPIGG